MTDEQREAAVRLVAATAVLRLAELLCAAPALDPYADQTLDAVVTTAAQSGRSLGLAGERAWQVAYDAVGDLFLAAAEAA